MKTEVPVAKINLANLKKTIYYLQRNGLRETWISVKERLTETDRYFFVPCSEETLEEQSRRKWDNPVTFSIIVPLYRTPEKYLNRMITSVMTQSYPYWELILADATEDYSVEETLIKQGFLSAAGQTAETAEKHIPEQAVEPATRTVAEFVTADERIHYIHLTENAGIAANTNQALAHATGAYIGLLDHDDVLTPDALYEMADAIQNAHDKGVRAAFVYSDEDKCDGEETTYYDPNLKEDFNYDFILSNNYICHFLVMEAGLMKQLKFRPACDGAQDYDLVLRAVAEVLSEGGREAEARMLHIPKVLYHWRCHESSTAANPHSKRYAYDAGLKALQDHAKMRNLPAQAVETKHVGFYRLQYQDVLQDRPDVAAVGGRILSGGKRGKTTGGRMTADGKVVYEGLPADFGGYLHRAELSQDAEALDLRALRVRKEYWDLFENIVGVPYTEVQKKVGEQPVFDVNTLPAEADVKNVSLRLSEELRKHGRLLYLPEYPERMKAL